MTNQQQIQNTKLMKSAPYCSASVAILIFIAKVYAYLSTNSVAILSTLVDSMLDISSSIIIIFAMHLSLQPPDNNHRFGHEKIEDLAIFSQSIFFLLSGLFAFFSSAKRFIEPHEITKIDIGINVMIFSSVLTLILLVYQSFVIKKTGSRLIIVDKIHYLTDLLTTLAVIISVYLSETWVIIDTLVGIAIAIYIIHSSYKIFIKSIKNLIDEEFCDEDKAKILSILSEFKKDVHAVHELKTRYAGSKPFVQFHIELDGKMNLNKAHTIIEKIMMRIETVFPGAEVIIHADPEGIEEGEGFRELVE